MFATNPSAELSTINFKEYEPIARGNYVPDNLRILTDKGFYNNLGNLPAMVRISNYFEIVYNLLFRNLIWILLFWVVFLWVCIELIMSRLKDLFLITLFVISCYLLFSILLVSIFQYPIMRLSYPTEIIYYLVPLTFLYYKATATYKNPLKK
jgi:hypothetical protein